MSNKLHENNEDLWYHRKLASSKTTGTETNAIFIS